MGSKSRKSKRKLSCGLGAFSLLGVAQWTPLDFAVMSSHLDICRSLIGRGANVNHLGQDSGRTPLFDAVLYGSLAICQLLVSSGADVNVVVGPEGDTPLHHAAAPLHHAAESGYLEIVKLLLSKGADPNARALFNITPLMLAARFGHIEVVRTLIAGGAEVNAQDRDGGTVLDNADEHPDIQRVLREAGAR